MFTFIEIARALKNAIIDTFKKLTKLLKLQYSEPFYFLKWNQELTRNMFVKHRCPHRQQSQNLQVLYFDPIQPQEHVMSVRCEQPLDELTVQV